MSWKTISRRYLPPKARQDLGLHFKTMDYLRSIPLVYSAEHYQDDFYYDVYDDDDEEDEEEYEIGELHGEYNIRLHRGWMLGNDHNHPYSNPIIIDRDAEDFPLNATQPMRKLIRQLVKAKPCDSGCYRNAEVTPEQEQWSADTKRRLALHDDGNHHECDGAWCLPQRKMDRIKFSLETINFEKQQLLSPDK